MKKYLALFLVALLLLGGVVYATVDTLEGEELTDAATIEGVSTTDTVEGQVLTSGAADYTDCSELGTWEFAYFASHASGQYYACKTGGAFTTASNPDAVAVTPPSPSSESGGSAMGLSGPLPLAADDYMAWDIDTKDIFDSSQGSLRVRFYADAVGATASYFVYIKYGNDDQFWVYVNTDETVCVRWESNGSAVATCTGNSITENAWAVVDVNWNIARTTEDVQISLNGGTWADDATDYAAWASEPGSVWFGVVSSESHDLYLDDIRVSTDTPVWDTAK